MPRFEYIKLPFSLIPADIQERYNLKHKVTENHVYVEVRKGMYGLPQDGKLANDLLQANLKPHGYEPVQHTPGLWKHVSQPIMFMCC